MGRKVGSEKTPKREAIGTEKAKKRLQREKENKKLALDAALFFKRQKTDQIILEEISAEDQPASSSSTYELICNYDLILHFH
jgi:hypothetical protein